MFRSHVIDVIYLDDELACQYVCTHIMIFFKINFLNKFCPPHNPRESKR